MHTRIAEIIMRTGNERFRVELPNNYVTTEAPNGLLKLPCDVEILNLFRFHAALLVQ